MYGLRTAVCCALAAGLLVLCPPGVRAQDAAVTINEIHYDADVVTEPVEFVELHNAGTTTVDLTGWAFDDGVTYTFPPGTSLAPGAYLLVGQDPAEILAKFGVVVLGPFSGRLENDGERVALQNAFGSTIDEVDYRRGFPWPTAGGTPGRSMQLLNAALDNDLGGSWRSDAPTPLAVNSVLAASNDIPPQIRQVDHSPNEPQSGETVRITAKVTDSDGVAAVTLRYQLVDPGSYICITDGVYETTWTDLAMVDDGTQGDETAGDDVFSVELGGAIQTHRRLVRYRITVEDALANSVRVPYADDPQPNFAYFVYDGVPAWTGSVRPGVEPAVEYGTNVMRSLPVYHLISRKADVEECTWIGKYGGSDYLWTGTLVYDGDVYDHVNYRARGGVWRYAMGKNMWKFNFHRGHRFRGRDAYGKRYDTEWDKLNFSACIQQGNYQHRGEQGMFEAVGFRLFELAGVPSPQTHWVQFRIVDDAAESTANQFEGDFWGLYLVIEQMDGRFLDEHGLADGNLYKMEGGSGTLNNQGPTAATDKSDLNAFINGYKTYPAAAWWGLNANLERYYGYRTIVEGIHHYDIGHGKNYFYYLNPVVTTNQWGATNRWSQLPWDLDLTWANNMYGNGNEPFKRYGCLDQPELNMEYRNRIRELRDLLFNADEGYRLIDDYAAMIDDPGGAASIVDADCAMWDYNPIMTNTTYVNLSKAGHGRFYQKAASKDFPGMVQIMKSYVVYRGTAVLDPIAADGDIPATPGVSAGGTNYPVNDLVFLTTPFSDPQGSNTFAAMEWRVGEITDTNAPAYDPADRPKYEIDPVWESGELTSYSNAVVVPMDAVKVGHTYRVRVRMKDATGRWSHWSPAHTFTVDVPDNNYALTHFLVFSEIMYNPPAGSDYEFVELHNTSAVQTLDLGGIRFSSGITYTVPASTSLAPGAYLLVVRASSTGYFAAFRAHYGLTNTIPIIGPYSGKLSNGGEQLNLKAGTAGDMIASVNYDDNRGWPQPPDGTGHSLVPLVTTGQADGVLDYGGNWRSSTCMKGSPGAADPSLPPGVTLNEIMAHTDYSNPLKPEYDSNDWIELFNASGSPVALAGWYLTDDRSDLTKWAIPGTNTVPAGGWLRFDEVTGFHSPVTNGFGLNKAGEEVFLSYLPGTAEDRVVDCVRFKGQEASHSLGRYPDGGGYWQALFPTEGAANAVPTQQVVVSELMYHPAPTAANPEDNTNDEYIEIRNIGASPTNLWNAEGTWRIDGGVSFSFPSNTSLALGERLVLVSFDPGDTGALGEFLDAYGMTNGEARILGPYAGKLSNRGERMALERPQAPDQAGDPVSWVIVDEVIYFDRAPWPTGTDATGFPLARTALHAAGNDPASWKMGFSATPGKPSDRLRITRPLDGTTLLNPAAARLTAAVNADAVSLPVANVTFSVGGSNIAVDTSAPYETALGALSGGGTHTLLATLQDAAGVWTSRTVDVTVSALSNSGTTNLGPGTATVRGTLSNGGGADVAVCWGAIDGGSDLSAWEHVTAAGPVSSNGAFSCVLTGLLYGVEYFYRVYGSNSNGHAWAPVASTFTTPAAELHAYEDVVLADAPVVYYRLNETAGPSAANLGSAAGYGGTFAGTVSLGLEAAGAGLGTALDLRGANNGYIDTGNNISAYLNTTASLEFWIRTTQSGGNPNWRSPALTGQDQGGGANDIWWGVNSGGRIGITIGNNTESPLTPSPINDDAWHHLLITRDNPSGVVNIYLDGQPSAVTTFDGADGRGLGIACNWMGHGSSGQSAAVLDAAIDEVAVYDRILTGQDAEEHFDASSSTGGVACGIANAAASGVTHAAANFHAVLTAPGAVFHVRVHWGDENRGTNDTWDHSAYVGSYTNVASTGVVYAASGFAPTTSYFYTFRATNAAEDTWCAPSVTFTTTAAGPAGPQGAVVRIR